MAVDVSLKLLSRRAGLTVLSCAGSLQSAMMAVSSFERSLTEEKLHDAEQRLQKSLQQIVVIDSQIRELEILYVIQLYIRVSVVLS
jgi:hypothetical protein